MHRHPPVSCFTLPVAEYYRRVEAAEDKADALRIQHNRPQGRYGCEILWHPLFAPEFVALVSGTSLPELAAWLPDLDNDGQPLDLYDYGYLADCLREGLADTPTPLAALRLCRALAWLEQAGEALLRTPAASVPASTAPHLAVAA